MKRLFNFNVRKEAERVGRSIVPHPRFTEVELENSLLAFARNMHGLARGMKHFGAGFALAAGLLGVHSALDGKPVPAVVSPVAAAALGVFARRKSQQQAFYAELTTVTADRQITGARKHLQRLAAGE